MSDEIPPPARKPSEGPLFGRDRPQMAPRRKQVGVWLILLAAVAFFVELGLICPAWTRGRGSQFRRLTGACHPSTTGKGWL
jgi:hypothetical protein